MCHPPRPNARPPRLEWTNARRIVVKIGSALVVDGTTGQVRATWLNALADDVAALIRSGKEVVIVSSGAIALGRHIVGFGTGDLDLDQSQAAAAVGQIHLAHAYQSVLSQRGLTAAQLLLTLNDTEERRRYLNARGTIDRLLRQGVVPVVNENDTVATNEIRYGDNDRLSARVATMATADCLVLLSDVDGLYSAPPDQDASAQLIETVGDITPEIAAMAGGARTASSRGGMVTKLEAGRIAMAAGTNMVITSGRALHPLSGLSAGKPCTWFVAPLDPVTARRRWITGQLDPKGCLTVDAGAIRALEDGKSLLPAGVTAISGGFQRGDPVRIAAADGTEIARGLTAYGSVDAARIIGHKTGEIARILGYAGRPALVHRDDMVLIRNMGRAKR